VKFIGRVCRFFKEKRVGYKICSYITIHGEPPELLKSCSNLQLRITKRSDLYREDGWDLEKYVKNVLLSRVANDFFSRATVVQRREKKSPRNRIEENRIELIPTL